MAFYIKYQVSQSTPSLAPLIASTGEPINIFMPSGQHIVLTRQRPHTVYANEGDVSDRGQEDVAVEPLPKLPQNNEEKTIAAYFEGFLSRSDTHGVFLARLQRVTKGTEKPPSPLAYDYKKGEQVVFKYAIDDVPDSFQKLQNEIHAYEQLWRVQGSSVPKMYGVYGSSVAPRLDGGYQPCTFMMMEYCNGGHIEIWSEENRMKALLAMNSIHQEGIKHGNIDLKMHFLHSGEGQIKAISFGRAEKHICEGCWPGRSSRPSDNLDDEDPQECMELQGWQWDLC